MILNIHSDASYLSEEESKIRAGFYMVIKTDNTNRLTNRVILIIITVFKHVMSSAAEEEIGAIFLNVKERTVFSYHTRRTGTYSAPNTF
jgi:hypothetical protein